MKKKDLDIQVEPWIMAKFSWHLPDDYQNRHDEYTIEMPRYMRDRWEWLISWRHAKLICMNPRVVHDIHWCFYDKKTGLDMGFDSLLSKISGAKAQITKWKNSVNEYELESKKRLFNNLDDDQPYQDALLKIKKQEEKLVCLLNELDNELKKKDER